MNAVWRVTWTNPDGTTGWRDIDNAVHASTIAGWHRDREDHPVTVEEINP